MPPARGFNRQIIKWGLERAQEGQKLLENLAGYGLIQPALDQMANKAQLAATLGLEKPNSLATTSSNRFKKVLNEWVAAQTDIKPFWEIKTYNHKFDQQAEISSKLSTWWYLNSHADQRGLGTALRWAAVSGTGYIHLHWNPRAGDSGELQAEGKDPRDVLPIGPLPPWDTTQEWEGVVIRDKKTVEYCRDLAGEDNAHLIVADRGADEGGPLESTRAGRILAEINMATRSPLADVLFSDQPKTDIGKQPSCDLFTMYIRDRSKNTSKEPVEMGQFMEDPTWQKPEGVLGLFAKAPRIPANAWSYIVEPDDKLYPRHRMVVFTRTAVIYDGPSLYWHGKFPLIKLTPDPAVDSLLGYSPAADIMSLQASLDWTLRIIDDHNAQVAQPMVVGDEMSIGPNTLKNFNTRRAGAKVIQNPMGKGIQIVPPPPLDNSIMDHRDWIMREMDDLSGVVDLKNLNNVDQIPSTETVDKMIESKSYLLQGRSRIIEAFMREFAEQMLYNFAEFFTLKMKYTILGPGGVTPEDFDYDPGSFVPDFVHSEDFDEFGNITKAAYDRGPMPTYDRTKEVIRQMHFYAAPGSMLSASDVTNKMLYTQAFRMNIMDIWTWAEKMGISGYGNPPDGAVTIPERLQAQWAMGINAPPSPVNTSNPGPGHPPTAQVPPHFDKGGTTISESK